MRINLDKSSILPVGDVENPDLLALKLGCKVQSLPTTYLGLPLGATHKSTMVWDAVEEKFRKRLALWKRQYISKGGRLTLIQSTLSCMLTDLMSLFRIPKSISMRLERIQRKFLWGGGALDRKIHNVNRKIVSSSSDRMVWESENFLLSISLSWEYGTGGLGQRQKASGKPLSG